MEAIPTEIGLLIIEHLSPEDLVNTVLTCSAIHRLATERLKKHRKLQERYRFISVSSDLRCQFLTEVHQNPRIWFYVKGLSYSASIPSISDMKSDYMDMVEPLLDSWPYMKYGDHLVRSGKEVIHKIRNGSIDDAEGVWPGLFLGILLSYLPNIARLVLQPKQQFEPELYTNMVETIVRANEQNPDLRALRKLSNFNILPLDHGNIAYTEWVTPLLGLPSSRKLMGSIPPSHDGFKWSFGERACTLEKITVSYSDIINPRFLSVLTNLRKLSYLHTPYLADPNGETNNSHEMLAYLAKSCSHTLEELRFTSSISPHRMSSSLRTFRMFERLKKLMFSFSWFTGLTHDEEMVEDQGNIAREESSVDIRPQDGGWCLHKRVPRLVDILPSSLEVLDVDVYYCAAHTVDRFFEGLVELKRQRCPNLKFIKYKEDKDTSGKLNPLHRLAEREGMVIRECTESPNHNLELFYS